jgi:uncharacterized protein (TIGR03437 family)
MPLGEGSRADFKGWPGSGSTRGDWVATLGADPLTLRAEYQVMNRLDAAANPPDGVSWSIQPQSPDGFYETQATVSVTVIPRPGFRFRSWSGDLSGTRPSGVVAMSAPRAVSAQLDRVPYISPAGVMNAAGVTPQEAVAAGSVVSIFGASLAPEVKVGPESPLAQTISGVMVRLGDRVLPLFFVSPNQINLQLPDDVPGGSHTLTVSAEGMPDVRAAVTVVRNAPGLFPQVVNEQLFAVAFHEDGSPVTIDAPALRGELLTVYGTGFGPAVRPRPEGFALPAAITLEDVASVLVGDAAPIEAAATAVAGRVGVDAVQFRLGDDAPTGTIAPLRLRIGGQESNAVLMAVK